MNAPPLTVAGIGSRHSTDDGIGLRLVAALNDLPEDVRREQWEDADALSLAHRLLESTGPLLIVDCAEMGLNGGEWRCFTLAPGASVKLIPNSRSISTHGLGLAESLAIAHQLGLATAVSIFAVQPFDLELCPPSENAMQNTLSAAMQDHLPQLLKALRQNIDMLSKRMPEEA